MSNGLKPMFGRLILDMSMEVPKDVELEDIQENFDDEVIRRIDVNVEDVYGFVHSLRIHNYLISWDGDYEVEEDC